MNRRNFLQSVSAAMSAVALGVTFKPVATKIRYDLFTDTSSAKWDLSLPFGLGDNVYATDARVVVCHPGDVDMTDGTRRVPAADRLQWDEFEAGGWKPLGQSTYCHQSQNYGSYCVECLGLGRTGPNVRRCPDCDGDSEWFNDDGKMHDGCEKCRCCWIGGPICGKCKGEGYLTENIAESIGGFNFSPAMVGRIRTLGELDVKVIESPANYHWTASGLMLFRGDHGIRGMLMGLVD